MRARPEALAPYLDQDGLTLYHGRAEEVLSSFESASADAIVTSPPYADARPDVEGPPLDSFAEWFEPILAELLRIVSPTGSLMLNLGRRFRDGEEHPFHDETKARARAVGWRHIDTVVWHKTNPAGRANRYLNNAHEYVYWLAPSVDAYRGYDAETRRPYSPEALARFKRAPRAFTKFDRTGPRPARPPHPLGAKPLSIFACSVGREKGNPHPTPIPDELARHLVGLSCPPSASVLDPFCGSGNILRAALASSRRATGIDIEEQWLRLTADRVSAVQLALGNSQ